MLLEKLGDRILVIGDDLVTTNDRTIEMAASQGLINSVLVKANQIGTLYETLLAVLVTLGKDWNWSCRTAPRAPTMTWRRILRWRPMPWASRPAVAPTRSGWSSTRPSRRKWNG